MHLELMSPTDFLLSLIFGALVVIAVILFMRYGRRSEKHIGPVINTSNKTEVRKEVIPPANVSETYHQHFHINKGDVVDSFDYCTRCGILLVGNEKTMPFHEVCPKDKPPRNDDRPPKPRTETTSSLKKDEKIEVKTERTKSDADPSKKIPSSSDSETVGTRDGRKTVDELMESMSQPGWKKKDQDKDPDQRQGSILKLVAGDKK